MPNPTQPVVWRLKREGNVSHRCQGKWRRGRTVLKNLRNYTGVGPVVIVPRFACIKCLSYFEVAEHA